MDEKTTLFDVRLGAHLRRLRQQKGLSLLDVEAASGKEFKASVLGAYERGERALSVRRLARLGEIYRVPLDGMLPRDARSAEPRGVLSDGGVPIDLRRLQQVDAPEGRVLWRYVQALQAERGDWGGRVLTIRRDDVRALAAALGTTDEELATRLEDLGLSTAGSER